MANLPDDILREIIPRLPVKSLLRFECVRKHWFALITDPKFIEAHLNRTTKNNEVRFLLKYTILQYLTRSDRKSGIRDYQLDCIDNNTSCLVKEGLEKEFPFQFSKSTVIKDISSSCDGLFCITYNNDSVCLWNPSTGEFRQIPTTNEIREKHDDLIVGKTISYGVGYDHVIHDYKIVKLIYFSYYYEDIDDSDHFDFSHPEVKVYTLGTNTWRKIEDHPHHNHDLPDDTSTELLHGFLHWLLIPQKGFLLPTPDAPCSPQYIVAFDLANEKFREVPPPPLNNMNNITLHIWEGCLCIGKAWDASLFYTLWVMKDYGVKDSWTKLFTISEPIRRRSRLRPLHFSKTGEVIFPIDDCLHLYDPEHENFRSIKVCEEAKYIHQTQVYVGSLVSLKSGTYVGQQIEMETKEERDEIMRSTYDP